MGVRSCMIVILFIFFGILNGPKCAISITMSGLSFFMALGMLQNSRISPWFLLRARMLAFR